MSQLYDETRLTEFFKNAPADNSSWTGDVLMVDHGRELVPFKFGANRYLLILGTPTYEAGGEESLFSMAAGWAAGYKPKLQSRIIKFARADASDGHFDPSLWRLEKPKQIFGFCDVLQDVVENFIEAKPEVEQFFFWPTNDRLKTLYRRVFRSIDAGCFANQFVSILEPIGEFYGYQRSDKR